MAEAVFVGFVLLAYHYYHSSSTQYSFTSHYSYWENSKLFLYLVETMRLKLYSNNILKTTVLMKFKNTVREGLT